MGRGTVDRARTPTFVIRSEQLRCFEEAALAAFIDAMADHLAGLWPRHCRSIGRENQRRAIQSGICRARDHGFSRRGPVRFFLELTFPLGSEFDTDPQLPWAARILVDPTEYEMDKAQRLYAAWREYRDRVRGSANLYTVRALHRARKLDLESLDRAHAATPDSQALLGLFGRLHPEKAAVVGDEGLRAIIRRADEMALRLGARGARGVAVLALLAFFLGHRFDRDLLYPWIQETLEHATADGGGHRALDRLEAKTRIYLESVLDEVFTGDTGWETSTDSTSEIRSRAKTPL